MALVVDVPCNLV